MKLLALILLTFVTSLSGSIASELEKLRYNNRVQKQRIAILEKEIDNLHNLLEKKSTGTKAKAKKTTVKNKKTSSNTSYGSYKIQANETFYSIARKHKISVEALMKANPSVPSNRIVPGKILKIPNGKNSSTSAKTSSKKTTPTKKKVSSKTSYKTYKIQANETFYSISRKHKVSVDALMKANPNVPSNRIIPGKTLKIPTGKTSTSTKTTQYKPKTKQKPKRVTQKKPTPKKTVKKKPTPKKTVSKPVVSKKKQKKITPIVTTRVMTLAEFAKQHNISLAELHKINNWSSPKKGSLRLAVGSEIEVWK